jgi:hypothetical protein
MGESTQECGYCEAKFDGKDAKKERDSHEENFHPQPSRSAQRATGKKRSGKSKRGAAAQQAPSAAEPTEKAGQTKR